jgi:hypothetical protein
MMSLEMAYAINDNGQIVGMGRRAKLAAGDEHHAIMHAFLLTPISATAKGNSPANDPAASQPASETPMVAVTKYNLVQPGLDKLSYAGTTDVIGGPNGKGCLLACLAMALSGAGISEGADPVSTLQRLDALLLKGGAYKTINGVEGNIDLEAATRLAVKAAGMEGIGFDGKYNGSSSRDALNELLQSGCSVIVAVHYHATDAGWTHFVLVTGRSGKTYSIYDPADPNSRTLLSAYGDVFQIRGYVGPARGR